jgi:hypothetical protein
MTGRRQLPAELSALMLRYAQLGQLLPAEIDADTIDETKLVLAEMDKVRSAIHALIHRKQQQ